MTGTNADPSRKTEKFASEGTIAVAIETAQPPQTKARQLGPYLLEEELGRGAMGAVYKAFHTKLKRTIALKILPHEFGSSPARLDRFQREMEAAGRLDHPNIVRASDAGEIAGTHYIAMEIVDGIDLERLVDRHGPIDIGIACELIRQAALGLQHIHDNQLVHRDIKPSNLIVTRMGVTKILDLGIARLHQGEELSTLTSVGGLMGTPDFMAPEQIKETGCVDIRADIYSLGCTLYNLIAGRAPFEGPEYDTRVAKIVAHTTEEAVELSEVVESCPAELSSIVKKMMAKDPNDRYSTPSEVAEALADWSASAEVPEFLAGIGDTKRSKPASPKHRVTPRAKRATKRLVSWVVVGIAVLCGLGVLFFRSDRDGRQVQRHPGDAGHSVAASTATGNPGLLQPLQEVAKHTENISRATETLVTTGSEINENTSRIADSLEHLREVFQTASREGAVVADPQSVGELYHNAQVYARQGKNLQARECYLRIVQSGTDFVDVHTSFQQSLIVNEGLSRARELYAGMPHFASDESVRAWATAMLSEPAERQRLLAELVEADPDFAPGIYALSQCYSQANGTQTLTDQERERQLLEAFLAAHQRGNLLRYFLDQREAKTWLDDANRRLARLQPVNATMYEHPVSSIFQKQSFGWNLIFQVAEPARELFYRQGGEDEFKSTGFGQNVDPRTGQAMPKMYVTLPAHTQAGFFEVKYTDQNGYQRGPFRVEFAPAAEEIANYKRILELTKHGWLQFGVGAHSDKLYFTNLAVYKKAIKEVRYAIDRETPDTVHVLTDPKSARSMNNLFVTVAEGASFATVQLLFVDDTASEVVRIDRRDP